VADVFISYSKARKKETVALAAALEGKGFSVWWDSGLTPGESFGEVIMAELARARAAIVIWTPASVKSKWVISEAGRADRQGVLIAVRSPDLRPEDIPPPFDLIHTELCTNVGAVLAALAKKGVAPSGAFATERTAAPERRSSPVPSRRALLLGAGIVCAGGLLAAAYWRQRAQPALRPARVFDNEGVWVTAAAYAPDSRQVLIGDWNGNLKLWDNISDQDRTSRTFEAGHVGPIWRVAVLRDHQRILTVGEDGTLKIWDLAARRVIRSYREHRGPIWSVAVLPDGRSILTASVDATLKLWDLEAERVTHTFQYESRVLAVAVTPDGQVAVSAAKDRLQAWSIPERKPLHAFARRHVGDVKSVVIAPNGRTVVSGGDDGTVRLWELSSGNELRMLQPDHQKEVLSIALSPDGRIALSGSADHSARLWDLSSGRALLTLDHGDSVEFVAIAPDGRTAISVCRDKMLRVWDIKSV